MIYFFERICREVVLEKGVFFSVVIVGFLVRGILIDIFVFFKF